MKPDISVFSGLAKVSLLWLFRHFYILDFSVLNKKQQQRIAKLWHAGASADAADELKLIGTIEGFTPELYQAYQPIYQARQPSVPLRAPQPSVPARRYRRRHIVPFMRWSDLRIIAVWAAACAAMMGGAIWLGPMHRATPQFRVAAVADAGSASSAVLAAPANNQSSAAGAAPANRVSSAVAIPIAAEPAAPVAYSPATAAEAPSHPVTHPPGAMAQDLSSLDVADVSTNAVARSVSSSDVKPSPLVAVRTKAPGKPEVLIRVSVDSQGRASAFQILQGNQNKKSAALNAAKRWSFQPCSGSVDCQHLLKFTDHGDASVVQMLN